MRDGYQVLVLLDEHDLALQLVTLFCRRVRALMTTTGNNDERNEAKRKNDGSKRFHKYLLIHAN